MRHGLRSVKPCLPRAGSPGPLRGSIAAASVSCRRMFKLDRPAFARLALAILLLLALGGAGRTTYRAQAAHRASRAAAPDGLATSDPATRHEARFREVRDALPASGVVGYVSDGLVGSAFTSMEAMQEYFLTQYSLAPLIVVRGGGQRLVVGNYSEPPATPPAGFTVLRDFGGGVLLFEIAEP